MNKRRIDYGIGNEEECALPFTQSEEDEICVLFGYETPLEQGMLKNNE